jgi:hypothetical protein
MISGYGCVGHVVLVQPRYIKRSRWFGSAPIKMCYKGLQGPVSFSSRRDQVKTKARTLASGRGFFLPPRIQHRLVHPLLESRALATMSLGPAKLTIEVAIASQTLERRVILTYDAPGVDLVVDALLYIRLDGWLLARRERRRRWQPE